MPYLRKIIVKYQSSGYLTDSGSHQQSCTKILSTKTAGERKSNAAYCTYKLEGSILVIVTLVRAFQNHVQQELVITIDCPHLFALMLKHSS